MQWKNQKKDGGIEKNVEYIKSFLTRLPLEQAAACKIIEYRSGLAEHVMVFYPLKDGDTDPAE